MNNDSANWYLTIEVPVGLGVLAAPGSRNPNQSKLLPVGREEQ